MKAVILAGGHGTRLAEETHLVPKPMIEIGGRPMLWHIMNIYAAGGVNEFLVACGYKAEVIRAYFANYYLHSSNIFVDLATGRVEARDGTSPSWRVGCVDTGLDRMTGGRLLALRPMLAEGTFMVTYGDGVADIDVRRLLAFHRAHGRLATVTAVRPPSRFGALQIDNGRVAHFVEKPLGDGSWINGGFFVFEPGILDYIDGDQTPLETTPLQKLAAAGELYAFQHEGFWKPMDTLREKTELEALWASGRAPWKVW